jgi:hypothetical protein
VIRRTPVEALSALDKWRSMREALGVKRPIYMRVDSADGRAPVWRVYADGVILAASDKKLVGRPT